MFTSQSIVKIGSEIQNFLKTKRAIDENKQKLPKRKLYETLKFLHYSSTLDDDFVEALKSLHILTFATDSTAKEVSEIYILLETARKLNGPEICILLAAYRIYNRSYPSSKMEDILKENGGNINTGHSKRWCIMTAKACGYSLPEYVESRQQILEELRLIVPRGYNQHTVDSRDDNFNPAGKFRLTGFGVPLRRKTGSPIKTSFSKDKVSNISSIPTKEEYIKEKVATTQWDRMGHWEQVGKGGAYIDNSPGSGTRTFQLVQ